MPMQVRSLGPSVTRCWASHSAVRGHTFDTGLTSGVRFAECFRFPAPSACQPTLAQVVGHFRSTAVGRRLRKVIPKRMIAVARPSPINGKTNTSATVLTSDDVDSSQST